MWKLGHGGRLLLTVITLVALGFAVDRYAFHGRLLREFRRARDSRVVLSSGDFPAGAAAPTNDVARVPIRPLRLAANPRGSTAALLLTSGGTGLHKDAPISRAFGIDLDLSLLPDEKSVTDALSLGGDRPGGADAATMSVDRFAQLRATMESSKLKAVLLLSRSRGHEVIAAAKGITQISALKGKRVAVPRRSASRFLLLWELAQAPLSPSSIDTIPVAASTDAARIFKEGRVDAAVGVINELANPARERGGTIIATSADAPHLLATILVVRGDFLARYPDAIRRLVKAILVSADQINREPSEAARLLATKAPQLGDPLEALRADPPAMLPENLAFFDIKGDTPVRYDELFVSAAAMWRKLGEPSESGLSASSRELGPLISVRSAP